MQSETDLKATMVHVTGDMAYEVVNSLEQIERIMCDEFIKPNTFINLTFTDGETLFIRKDQIVAFYKSED